MNRNHPIQAAGTGYLRCTEQRWAFVANLARAAPTKCIFECLAVTQFPCAVSVLAAQCEIAPLEGLWTVHTTKYGGQRYEQQSSDI